MQTLIDNTFQKLNFSPEKYFFEWVLTSQTLLMSADDFKQQTLLYAENVLTYKPRFLFINALKMEFVIDPPLQLWYGETIAPKTAQAGVKKVAFLVSRDIFVQMSVKQTEEEIATVRKIPNLIEIKYFESEKEAKNWLL